MKKTSNKKQQKQVQKVQKANQKNHGNFSKFIQSKTPSLKAKPTTTVAESLLEPDSTLNTSRLKDLRNQPSQFSNYLDNNYKSTKKIKLFDLDSDEEQNQNTSNNNNSKSLTHHGKQLNEIKNDFEISNGESEDEYNGKLQERMMKRTNFGGYQDDHNQEEGEEGQFKSKQEIYKEIIKKSKKMKYEKQKLREENDAKRVELDSEYKDLVPFLTFRKNAGPRKLIKKQVDGEEEDDYMQLKKSLETEEIIVRATRQVKKVVVSENEENQDNESNDGEQSEHEADY